jgi:polysaccharide export outer membrane protein
VTSRTTHIVANHQVTGFHGRFEVKHGAGPIVVGVGDQLKIIVFEASADGLFSTPESKQTPFDVVVQPDGTISIPYVGNVVLSGKTLDQVRQTIIEALQGKAVEPDVLVSLVSTASRNVSVLGSVGKPSVVPLGIAHETVMDVIARAGGSLTPPYETYVNLTRNKTRGVVLIKSLLENPQENIFVQPGDQVYLVHDPRTFTVLGSVRSSQRVNFGANDLNLLEAIALAGGADDQRSDVKGYFVFRYEEPEILEKLIGTSRLSELKANGMKSDKSGRYPLVYNFSMEQADSLMIGQNFLIKNRDIIYASRHRSVDFIKFQNLISRPLNLASGVISLSDAAPD